MALLNDPIVEAVRSVVGTCCAIAETDGESSGVCGRDVNLAGGRSSISTAYDEN